MIELAIDFETFCEEDIKTGVHKYCEHPSFEIMLCAYKLGNAETKIIDLKNGGVLPLEFIKALSDKNILKTAYNAAFEIACLERHLKTKLDTLQWSCTMVLAAQAGLPFGLDNVAKALNSKEQKDSKGKDLIKYFCVPCKPTKTNKNRTRNLPEHDLDKWFDFMNYCVQDVETEQAVRKHVSWYNVCEFEKPVWSLDRKVNSTGVLVDLELVQNAIAMDDRFTESVKQRMRDITGISNPKSNNQVKNFIKEQSGEEVKSLNKENMSKVKEMFEVDSDISEVLRLRDMLNMTSIRKFYAMAKSVCQDGRIRDLFQYYGANRTGRWAGRNVQLQNLKRNDLKGLDFARQLVKKNDYDSLELCYGNVGQVLSNLIRTAFIAKPGHKLIVSDLSAIEARIVAWFAQEKWRLDVFATHGKIYEASASMMFKVPIESIKKDSPLRMKGKIAELALGYQGAVGALERMGGAAMGLSQEEMLRLVKQWRNANKSIVKLWYDINDAAVETILSRKTIATKFLKFYMVDGNLNIQLPSGRCLVYISAKYDGTKISYYGLDQETKKWHLQDTYGGKLVENIVQATARDVITSAMKNLDSRGFNVIMHVHDEIVCENIFKEGMDKEMTRIMSEPISWAPGLPLGAETFVADYYQK